MQTLGLANSTPRTSDRFTSLLWPAIQNEFDVDYVTRQGFWICTGVGVMTVVQAAFQGPAMWVLSLVEGLFFYLAGVGIRQRSIAAAGIAFVTYALSSFVPGGGISVARFIFIALLLANVRGVWLSARWRPGATEPPPLPEDKTFSERFSGTWPMHVWRPMRWVFYALAALELLGLIAAIFLPPTTS